MDPTSHHFFETLKTWFSATAVPHGYEPAASHCSYLYHCLKLATFSTPDPEKFHLPHPTYLVIHAACAKIAHLSGAAEHIKKVLRRMEVTHVLAEDLVVRAQQFCLRWSNLAATSPFCLLGLIRAFLVGLPCFDRRQWCQCTLAQERYEDEPYRSPAI